MDKMRVNGSFPPIRIGWFVASESSNSIHERLLDDVIDIVQQTLVHQFPEFKWEMSRFERHVYSSVGSVDPLVLLELGAEEKLYRNLDYVIVFVSNELIPRNRIFVTGVPSSALETAVFSSARFMDEPDPEKRLAALVLHLLGHLFGVEHESSGVMRPTDETRRLELTDYSEEAKEIIRERLAAVADQRVEEREPVGSMKFIWRTLVSDPAGIFQDIMGYAPWRMPLYLGRYTAATAVTVIFLFLSAEAWELGGKLPASWLTTGAFFIVLLATLTIYLGQNFHQMGRVFSLREQLVRTRVVLFGALLLGISALWGSLFLIGLLVMAAFPKGVFAGWAGIEVQHLSIVHYAAFMATLGVVAGAFGGNLEEEAEIKAVFLFDEEA